MNTTEITAPVSKSPRQVLAEETGALYNLYFQAEYERDKAKAALHELKIIQRSFREECLAVQFYVDKHERPAEDLLPLQTRFNEIGTQIMDTTTDLANKERDFEMRKRLWIRKERDLRELDDYIRARR